MKKARTLLTIGIWVAILPYLGFPSSWKNILFVLTGLGLFYFAYVLYKQAKEIKNDNKKSFDSFSENREFREKSEKISI
ncbi:MAG: hypothetical protein NTZ44_03925 [Candidatus Nomurabacteria bacterium]|nr:hypothetical protein [Candidatus Nomurabacteria bacterium]